MLDGIVQPVLPPPPDTNRDSLVGLLQRLVWSYALQYLRGHAHHCASTVSWIKREKHVSFESCGGSPATTLKWHLFPLYLTRPQHQRLMFMETRPPTSLCQLQQCWWSQQNFVDGLYFTCVSVHALLPISSALQYVWVAASVTDYCVNVGSS